MPTAYVNGINMYDEYSGSGRRCCFHSFTSDCTMWTPQVPVFSQRCQFITYDIRGMGPRIARRGVPVRPAYGDVYQLVRHSAHQFVLAVSPLVA